MMHHDPEKKQKSEAGGQEERSGEEDGVVGWRT
jgi:hypothetical protein